MPRRNLLLLVTIGIISLICHHKAQNSRYGRVLVDAMRQIEQRFLEPVDQRELFEGAMAGMMRALDDPNSRFINLEALPEFNEALDQLYGGIGIQINLDKETDQLTVASPLFGAPAYKAGIRTGDKILKIDGRSTQGLSLDGARQKLRGEPDEPVTLTVLHKDEEQPVDVTIVRAIIQADTVAGDTRNGDGSWNLFLEGHDRIGYLRIQRFSEKTADELRRAVDWLVGHKMRGLILDLRSDPGGLLDVGIEICDMFIASGVIVTTRLRDRSIKQTYQATAKGTYNGFPMVVLINQHSASASEIVAACLQDHGRATIVGQRSFGKGTVQEILELEGGQGALTLTTASYWRPSGRNIHRGRDADEDDDWGVSPDEGYTVEFEDEQLERWHRWRFRRDTGQVADIAPDANDDGPDTTANGPDANGDDPSQPFVDLQLAKAVEAIEEALARNDSAKASRP